MQNSRPSRRCEAAGVNAYFPRSLHTVRLWPDSHETSCIGLVNAVRTDALYVYLGDVVVTFSDSQ